MSLRYADLFTCIAYTWVKQTTRCLQLLFIKYVSPVPASCFLSQRYFRYFTSIWDACVSHKMQREQRSRCFSLSGSAKECHKTPPESYFTFTRSLFYNILNINTSLFHQWHPACFWNNLVNIMFLTHCSYLHTFNCFQWKWHLRGTDTYSTYHSLLSASRKHYLWVHGHTY